MLDFLECPRCGDRSFERLETYSHCCQCLYTEDYWYCSDTGYFNAKEVLREYDEEEKSLSPTEIEFPIKSKLKRIGA